MSTRPLRRRTAAGDQRAFEAHQRKLARLPAAGHIYWRRDPVSYGGTGAPHPAEPFKVVIDVDPINTHLDMPMSSGQAQSYSDACQKLAKELAWRDKGVRELRTKATLLEQQIIAREYERLINLPEPTESEPGSFRQGEPQP